MLSYDEEKGVVVISPPDFKNAAPLEILIFSVRFNADVLRID